ncbi:PQQ-dependent sugar dehydrogenase [Halorussus lipolyticus]|uniref:PQQ-dependent sugar dehydrogenase n=1 Tax=Halorussus lipolyticus TaxID=3034024 RepID=UPI0023E7E395|nr:PQQ-dependent sugar dehydrogenase [Halorussus sp. DT80]
MDRRAFLLGGVAALSGGVTALSGNRDGGDSGRADASQIDLEAETSPIREGPSVGLEEVVSGFREPVAFAATPDWGFVADKFGTVFRYDRSADDPKPESFLDLRDRMAELTGWEMGLLGLELHPDFRTNGRFFVRYSAPPTDEVPPNYSHTFVLSEFRAEGGTANPDAERRLLEIPEPQNAHNSGEITFGPDGYLYVGVGDGGGVGDSDAGHADDWYPVNRGGNGQDIEQNLLGSILRIDVDDQAEDKPYAVPDDNPLVGTDGRDEQWAWGFRNPFRFGFSEGDLYVGDVGQENFEEVSLVRKGGNYGWNVKEGTSCYSRVVPDKMPEPVSFVELLFPGPLPICPEGSVRGNPLVDPIVSYPQERNGDQFGTSVIGGYVCQNPDIPELQGQYLFGDFFAQGTGQLFATTTADSGDGLRPVKRLSIAGTPDGELGEALLSYGRDSSGDLYVLTTLFGEGTGTVYRLTPP